MKAIIVDDEQRAQAVMENLLTEFCPDVTIMACCGDVPTAISAIQQHEPDVVFLDIEMPNYSGFELFSFFEEINFQVIFATAYSEYAIRAFEVAALDYLLKPIDIDKLEAAVAKARQLQGGMAMKKQLELLEKSLKSKQISRLALPISEGLVIINVDDIISLEADGSYTIISLKNRSDLLISKKLKYFEDLLVNCPQFFRIHRSRIVNLKAIENYNSKEALLYMTNQSTIKIARNKKQLFEDYINSYQ